MLDMLKISLALPALLALAVAAPPRAEALPKVEKARLTLAADRTAYAPGATVRIAAQVSIEPGWHINSHTPTFDYLIPTVLELPLPKAWGASGAATVHYPPAQTARFSFADQPLSVYQGEVEIDAEVRVPASAAAGPVSLPARLHYQACNDSQCLPPVDAAAQIQLRIAAASAQGPAGSGRSAAPALIGSRAEHAAAAKSPKQAGGAERTGQGASPPPAAPGPGTAAKYPPHPPAPAALLAPTAPRAAPAAAPAAAASAPRLAPPHRPLQAGALGGILLLAVLGGFILNAMPCVLPVVSLKVFGLLRSAGEGRRAVVSAALATSAGILASFWALAAVSAAAAAAGSAAGWGVLFQRPGFVALLAIVVVLFCLNLWGLFEIQLPVALARLGGSGPREGLGGHFVSGLFATMMATPCSAPFLGTAISFALVQPWPVIFAVFTAVGVGLALPYLLLAAVPATARLLPRPGPWMETLRGVMGFLLAGSAVWLLYVLGNQVSPERLAAVELTLVAIALLIWMRHRALPGRALARTAAAGMLGAVVLALTIAAGGTDQAGTGTPGEPGTGGGRRASASGPAGLIRWVPFDRGRAETLGAGGGLVFVDVTADWCFTCKVNERLILDTPEVAGAFSRYRVVPMRADWTNRSDEIARFLADHGRYGIPFYLLYRPGGEPLVFSELPSKSEIVRAIESWAHLRAAL